MANKHGYRSALDGYVGSLKFYSKALTTTEAEQGYYYGDKIPVNRCSGLRRI